MSIAGRLDRDCTCGCTSERVYRTVTGHDPGCPTHARMTGGPPRPKPKERPTEVLIRKLGVARAERLSAESLAPAVPFGGPVRMDAAGRIVPMGPGEAAGRMDQLLHAMHSVGDDPEPEPAPAVRTRLDDDGAVVALVAPAPADVPDLFDAAVHLPDQPEHDGQTVAIWEDPETRLCWFTPGTGCVRHRVRVPLHHRLVPDDENGVLLTDAWNHRLTAGMVLRAAREGELGFGIRDEAS